jgi:hypothetical protein
MLNSKEVLLHLEMNLKINGDYIAYVDSCFILLKEPMLFVKAANKMLMLESVRQIKYILEKIIINLSKWSKYSKKDMIERISCEVMYLVHKFRDVQEAFNTKFGADAYINLKTEELRRYIRTISNKQNIDEIRISFENYLAKINIDFESIQFEYIDNLHEWFKIIMLECSVEQIFNENSFRNSETTNDHANGASLFGTNNE